MADKSKLIEILAGTEHHPKVPDDMQKLLLGHPDILKLRNGLTKLARNEWICRVTIVKQDITRAEHIIRMHKNLLEGIKRPCCRP